MEQIGGPCRDCGFPLAMCECTLKEATRVGSSCSANSPAVTTAGEHEPAPAGVDISGLTTAVDNACAEIDRLRAEISDLRDALVGARAGRLVNGYDAEFWYGSYKLLSDAVLEHLSEYVRDDDVAEEAIFVEAIEKAGAALSARLPSAREEQIAPLPQSTPTGKDE